MFRPTFSPALIVRLAWGPLSGCFSQTTRPSALLHQLQILYQCLYSICWFGASSVPLASQPDLPGSRPAQLFHARR